MPVLPFFRVQCAGSCGQWLVLDGPDSFSSSSDWADAAHFETYREALQAAGEAEWIGTDHGIHCGKCVPRVAS